MVDLADVLPDVSADFSAVLDHSARARLVMLDHSHDPAVSALLPDADEWLPAGQQSQVLLVVGNNISSVDAEWSGRGALAVEVASLLQEYVMDQLNARWPVRSDSEGVAEPELRGGSPRWVWKNGVTPFGQLTQTLSA
ncbi:hypothetical protein [Gryllotalpicola koreensis]|uniref:hypothetical protein n=1 Tax=Gryllotalpicola koreensis TaxID=993086 RepID=UPI0031D74EC9